MRPGLVAASVFISACLFPQAARGQEAQGEPLTKEEKVKALIKSIVPYEPPPWLRRTRLQLKFTEDLKPAYSFETVQPLVMSEDENSTLFTQLNAKTRGSDHVFNLGLGYRSIFDERLVLGANAFYDYTTYYGHQRIGFGMEALGVDYEARSNAYIRTTNGKEIDSGVTEKVMSGFDAEVGGNIFPWGALYDLRVYAGYQYFNSTFDGDLKYYNIRVAYPVSKHLEVEVKMMKEEGSDERFYIQFTGGFNIGVRRQVPATSLRVLREKLLQPVERENEMLIEQKRASTGGFSIKIKRGS